MRLFYFLGFVLIAQFAFGQSFFRNIEEAKVHLRTDQEIILTPDHFQLVELDLEALRSHLQDAPSELASDRNERELEVKIPMPDGSSKVFYLYESPNMMPGISARYPLIKSYKGYGRANAQENLRFSLSHKGLYAAIRTAEGTVYIDPYTTNNTSQYMSYFVKDQHSDLEDHQLLCGTTADLDNVLGEIGTLDPMKGQNTNITLRGDLIPLRQYRLAISCTGEWGQLRNGIEDILSDINVTVNRLNMIFENELSIRMMLIDQNDKIVYEDPNTDPYNIPNGVGTRGWLLARNTNIINNTIGEGSYDLGHIYHRSCTDVGGVAYLNSICSSTKGGGVTCHSSQNLEYVTVSIAAHEMGHQLGSPHSFNNCGGNESIGDGFEPGSGSTIMSYAGLCGNTNNVQNFNDDYYHVGSLMNMYNTTRLGNGVCAEQIDINNHEPDVVIDRNSGFFIPISTPFILTGIATDEDGDNMTYNWDQTNSGPITPLGTPVNNSPLFRSFYPNEDPTRIFPSANKILANFSDKTEILPTYSRDLTFQFVARDNNPGGGTVSWTGITFKSIENAGPFEVTYPTQSVSNFQSGDEINVLWDVANTDLAPVNCSKVNIYMSYGGELNTDVPNQNLILLASEVSNDGEQPVVIPNRVTNQGRIIVRAVDNIFFDVNNNNFFVQEPVNEIAYFETSVLNLDLCSSVETIDITTFGLGGFEGNYQLEVGGLPSEAAINLSNENPLAGETSTLTIDLSAVKVSEKYDLIVKAIIPDGDTLTRIIPIQNTATDFSDLAYIEPTNGTSGGTSLPTFTWTEATNAENYYFELATNPAFTTGSIVQAISINSNNYVPDVLLETSTVYYWRVRAENKCSTSNYPEIFAFSTETLSCDTYNADNLPLNITQSGTVTQEANIPVNILGQVADVNVKRIKGLHERNKDLYAYLVAPSGEEVLLFGNVCGNQSNFNCGFDDESPNDFSCPLNSQNSYKPAELLSTFIGQDINGNWTLRLEDRATGNGGKFEEISLELCSNLSLDPPILVNLNALQLPPGAGDIIQSPILLTTDANNTNDEIKYTLIVFPSHGQLELNGLTLSVGDQWSQSDIQNNRLIYRHNGDDSTSDMFRFDVQDGEGGWISITQFDIELDESFATSTADLAFDQSINLYPNPAMDQVTITHTSSETMYVRMMDIAGKLVIEQTLSSGNTIPLDQLKSGMYLLKINAGDKTSTKKLMVQR